MINVAIVDDHSVVRFGLKYVLKLGGDLQAVAEGVCAQDAVRIARDVKPDVMLLDVRMPGEGGIAALKQILAENPQQKVLMLTTSDTEEDIFQAIKAGAKGYVLKETEPGALVAAIRTVAGGGTAFPEEIMRVYEIRKSERALSPREKEVLAAVAKGFNTQDIADALGVSNNSVKMHLKHIYEKLCVSDRAEAVATAIRRGIIES